jgi:hypothetical protein
MKAKEQPAETAVDQSLVCLICGKVATRLVDGDPSCDEHAELVYEDQVESYTQRHQADGEWLENKV